MLHTTVTEKVQYFVIISLPSMFYPKKPLEIALSASEFACKVGGQGLAFDQVW